MDTHTMDTARTPAPNRQDGAAPCNPPPQRRAILRSVSGMSAADPTHVSFSRLLTGGIGRTGCGSVVIVAAF